MTDSPEKAAVTTGLFSCATARVDASFTQRMYADGKIKPYVSERFPLAKAADAIKHLASRQAMGKVVVTVD